MKFRAELYNGREVWVYGAKKNEYMVLVHPETLISRSGIDSDEESSRAIGLARDENQKLPAFKRKG